MKLLFIGNSHTYYNSMLEMLLHQLELTDIKPHITMLAEGGKDLAYHVTAPMTAFNIRCGGYDMVVAQDRAAGFDPVSFRENAKALKEMADKAGSAFYLYMPWTGRDNRSAQRDMTETYHNFCRANGCLFAPVGEVYTRLLNSEPPESLYREDGVHATPLGGYLTAVTIFYTITGRKRVMRVDSANDPGIRAGFPEALCQKIHTEACRMTRLFNG